MGGYAIKELRLKLQTYFFLDPRPDNLGHLVTIEVTDWLCHLDFGSKASSSECRTCSGKHFILNYNLFILLIQIKDLSMMSQDQNQNASQTDLF